MKEEKDTKKEEKDLNTEDNSEIDFDPRIVKCSIDDKEDSIKSKYYFGNE